jgi:ribosomal protein L2
LTAFVDDTSLLGTHHSLASMLSFRHGLSGLAKAYSPLITASTSALKAPLRNAPPTFPLLSHRTYASEAPATNSVNEALARTTTLYKTYKPVSPGIRHLKRPLNPHLWEGKPMRELTMARRRRGGRNHQGRITVRFIGGGHKQRIRLIDFHRTTPGPHDVVRIEYDPGRSAHIALLRARDPNVELGKHWSYIIACEGLRAGDVIQSFRNGIPNGMVPGFVDSKDIRGNSVDVLNASKEVDPADEAAMSRRMQQSSAALAIGVLRAMTVKPGNLLPMRLIPTGTIVHNVTLQPGGPARLVRSAGTFAQVVSHEDGGKYTHVRLQSGEVRKILQDCCATIGKVSNPLWKNRNLGKAGRSRWLGRRPHVRGMAMNAYVFLFSKESTPTDIRVCPAVTILTVVDVVNPRVTSTLVQSGAGSPRASVPVSPVPRARRTVTRWSFASAPVARRSASTRAP